MVIEVAEIRDLRAFIRRLDERGKLYRFTEPINKDTELYPAFRVQQRGLRDDEMLTGSGELMRAAGERPERVDLVLGKPVTSDDLRSALRQLTCASLLGKRRLGTERRVKRATRASPGPCPVLYNVALTG